MRREEDHKEHRFQALVWAIGIHAVLIGIFIFSVFKNPDPPLFADNSGVEVNFGLSDEGMGDIQPEPFTETSASKPKPAAPDKENILTQDQEEAPVISKENENKKPDPVKETPKEPEKKEEPKPVVNANALYKGKKNNSPKGNEGETGKPGDQGIKEGSVYSKVHGKTNGTGNSGEGDGSGNGSGGPGGKGISFDLSGRKLLKAPDIYDRSQETGKVVVSITVDKNGNVTKAIPGARGSTTTSTLLYSKAQQAAMRAKFNANPDAMEEQRGTITFNFIVQ